METDKREEITKQRNSISHDFKKIVDSSEKELDSIINQIGTENIELKDVTYELKNLKKNIFVGNFFQSLFGPESCVKDVLKKFYKDKNGNEEHCDELEKVVIKANKFFRQNYEKTIHAIENCIKSEKENSEIKQKQIDYKKSADLENERLNGLLSKAMTIDQYNSEVKRIEKRIENKYQMLFEGTKTEKEKLEEELKTLEEKRTSKIKINEENVKKIEELEEKVKKYNTKFNDETKKHSDYVNETDLKIKDLEENVKKSIIKAEEDGKQVLYFKELDKSAKATEEELTGYKVRESGLKEKNEKLSDSNTKKDNYIKELEGQIKGYEENKKIKPYEELHNEDNDLVKQKNDLLKEKEELANTNTKDKAELLKLEGDIKGYIHKEDIYQKTIEGIINKKKSEVEDNLKNTQYILEKLNKT